MQSIDFEIENQVIRILSDSFSVGHSVIDASSRLVEDLYIDSMNVVEIVMALNGIFHVELPQSEVAGWRVVADIVSSVVRVSASNKKLLNL